MVKAQELRLANGGRPRIVPCTEWNINRPQAARGPAAFAFCGYFVADRPSPHATAQRNRRPACRIRLAAAGRQRQQQAFMRHLAMPARRALFHAPCRAGDAQPASMRTARRYGERKPGLRPAG
jgi:hypothetical protein